VAYVEIFCRDLKEEKDQRECGILKEFMGGDEFQTLDHALFPFMWPMWWGGIKGVIILPLPALTRQQWQLSCQETINKVAFLHLVRRKKVV